MAQAKLDEQGSVDAFKMRRERELNGKLRNEIVPPPRDGFSLTTIIAVGAVSLAAGAIAAALVVH